MFPALVPESLEMNYNKLYLDEAADQVNSLMVQLEFVKRLSIELLIKRKCMKYFGDKKRTGELVWPKMIKCSFFMLSEGV